MVLFFQEPRPKQTFPLLLSGLHSFLRLERAVRCPPQQGLMGLKSGNRSNCRIDVENPCRPSFPARFSPEGEGGGVQRVLLGAIKKQVGTGLGDPRRGSEGRLGGFDLLPVEVA